LRQYARGESMKPHFIENKLKELATETDKMKRSAFFQEYLETMAKFWKYSYYNQLLIHFNRPKSTRVAGLKAWQSLGRKVKKGSKAIQIRAPVKIKDSDEVVRFIPVNVFDISQTEGEPLPKLDIALEGDNYTGLKQSLLDFCKSKSIEVEFKKLGVNGLYGYSRGGKVAIASNGSVNTQVNTLIHEITHELLHHQGEKLTEKRREIQAESTAYVVCRHFGLETKSYNYLLLYDADYQSIMDNLKAVAEASREVIDFVS